MQTSAKKNRSNKYEAARILAAFIIILNHINQDAALNGAGRVFRFNAFATGLFHMGGKFGVNVFVIISAWFLCGQAFKAKRIWRVLTQVVFYAVAGNVAAMIAGGRLLSAREFLMAFTYWFPFAYIVMLLVSPLLNRLLEKPKQLRLALAAGGALFLALFLLRYLAKDSRILRLLCLEHVIGPVWFCWLYLVTACVKKANLIRPSGKTLYLAGGIAAYFLMYLLVKRFNNWAARDMFSPVCALSALLVFAFFESLRMKDHPLVNTLATATFGTYLLQCHNNLAPIVNRFLNSAGWLSSPLYLLFCILTAAGFFAAALGITRLLDFLRNRLPAPFSATGRT